MHNREFIEPNEITGHANFLDELVEEFHIDDREQDPRRQQKVVLPKSKASEERLAAAALSPQKPKSKPQEKPVEYDDDADTASDSWSECDDSDDDTGHALVRTESGRSRPVEEDLSSDDEDIYGIVPQLTKSGETSTNTSPESLFEGINDYFNHREPSSKVAADEHPDKQVNAADVEVVSPGAVHA